MVVYVITAREFDEQKECIAVSSVERAMDVRDRLMSIYGGSAVVMSSVALDEVPQVLGLPNTGLQADGAVCDCDEPTIKNDSRFCEYCQAPIRPAAKA